MIVPAHSKRMKTLGGPHEGLGRKGLSALQLKRADSLLFSFSFVVWLFFFGVQGQILI